MKIDWHDIKEKLQAVFAYSLLIFLFVGCCRLIETESKDYNNYDKPSYEELEDRISELEDENSDLKSKLNNINEMASDRSYNYNELLDDIEDESEE